jgi:hypothetical protein
VPVPTAGAGATTPAAGTASRCEYDRSVKGFWWLTWRGNSGCGRGGGGGDHLHWNTSAERSCTSGVLAAYHADAGLSSDCSGAGHSSGNGGGERKILHLGVAVAATIAALEVLSDGDGRPVCPSTSCVDHALVWSRTVRVDLVDSHHDLTAGGDLRESGAVDLHDRCGTGLDCIVASTEGLTAAVCGITTESSRVLLEGVAVGAVTRSGWVDSNSGSSATSITSSTDDSSVASHEGGGSQKAEGNNGGLGEVHTEPVR